MRKLFIALVAVLGASTATAQTYTFDILQASSNFTWSGTTSVGSINPVGTNAFQFKGPVNTNLVFQAGAQPIASATMVDGAAMVVPDLQGVIPNPIPILPPLATISVNGLVLSPSAPSFPVALNGSFTAAVTLTATAGTLSVTPLGSGTTVTSLAGNASNPTNVSGTFTINAAAIRMNLPVSSSFAFAQGGVTGSISVAGTIVADHARVKSYCPGDGTGTACPCANHSPVGQGRGCLTSQGVGGLLAASGVAKVSADTFVLTTTGVPMTASVLMFQGTQASGAGGAGTVFGDGKRCATGTVIRFAVKTAVAGVASYPGAGNPLISVRGMIPATGGQRYYQGWFRNAAVFCTADTFNLTNGLVVTWLP